jgi:nucleoside phosphorylase
MPTHFLTQSEEQLRTVPNAGLDAAEIAIASGRDVHVGPVLTVDGTLMQNKALLHYYRKVWRAVGLEMEGESGFFWILWSR